MLPLAQIAEGPGRRSRRVGPQPRPGPHAGKVRLARSAGLRPVPAGRQRHHLGRAGAGRLARRSRTPCPKSSRAKELGCPRMTRAELLSRLFNAAPCSASPSAAPAASRPSPAMLGWIMHDAGRDPTIMNGAVMKNFVAPDESLRQRAWWATATCSSAKWTRATARSRSTSPTVAVLLNVSLDHKSMEELRQLFGDFLRRADTAVGQPRR